MLVNVNQVLKTLDGQVMKDTVEQTDDKGKKTTVAIDATVKVALVNAVASPEKTDTPVDKIRKGELARKIFLADGEIDLTAEEISECKKRVGEVFPNPILVLQLTELLEGK